MAREHPHGSGADARTSRLGFEGMLTGARLWLRYSPQDSVRLAADRLVDQGFVVRDDGFDQMLRAQGSPWTAISLEIGDEKRSNRTFWTGLLVDELPIPLPKVLQHSIPPTLVVVTARGDAGGMTELVLYPHSSRRGDPEFARAAHPRLRAAVKDIVSAATTSGALASHEVMRGIANDGCPASQAVVREMLRWQ